MSSAASVSRYRIGLWAYYIGVYVSLFTGSAAPQTEPAVQRQTQTPGAVPNKGSRPHKKIKEDPLRPLHDVLLDGLFHVFMWAGTIRAPCLLSASFFFCSPTSRYEFNDTANTMSMPCASLSQRDDLRNGKPRQLRHPRTFQCLDAPTACGTPRAQGVCVVATASCCEGGVCHFA